MGFPHNDPVSVYNVTSPENPAPFRKTYIGFPPSRSTSKATLLFDTLVQDKAVIGFVFLSLGRLQLRWNSVDTRKFETIISRAIHSLVEQMAPNV